MEYAALDWVDRFKTRRLLASIRSTLRAEEEASFYAVLETEAMAAQLMQIKSRQTRCGSLRGLSGQRERSRRIFAVIRARQL